MSKIKLTVIIPTYNSMPYLKQAIKSVVKQNFKNWEIIISDDQSTDGTIKFLKSIKHKKIKIFFQKKNLGIFGNLQFLDSKVSTSIVKILSADDYLLSNSLKETYLFMKKFPACKLMTCYSSNKLSRNHIESIILRNDVCSKMGNRFFIKFTPKSSMVAFFAFGNICGNLSRATYRKVNKGITSLFDQKYPYAGDFNAWARLSKKYGFYLIKKNLVYVRIHPGQATYTLEKTLNPKNNRYRQLSRIYNFLINNIDKKYHSYLRKYMLLNNLPQRIRSYIKYLIYGKIKLANKVFADLPLKISILDCFTHFIFYKYRNNSLNKVNKSNRNQIVNIINELGRG